MGQVHICYSAPAQENGKYPDGTPNDTVLGRRSICRLDRMLEDAFQSILDGHQVSFAFGAGSLKRSYKPLSVLQGAYVTQKWSAIFPGQTMKLYLPGIDQNYWGTEEEVDFAQSAAEENGCDELRLATEDYHADRTRLFLREQQRPGVRWELLIASTTNNPPTEQQLLQERRSLWCKQHLPRPVYLALRTASRVRLRMNY